ncbi:DUF2523 domain-containing protein [Methylobacter sp. Wu1]|jgi:hypothetical protein|uniref:DUF2523 domain-containing protein n=1 Tax=Methylobacter sp. Wu1 TaxID=3119359 RepID=UPI002F92B0BD
MGLLGQLLLGISGSIALRVLAALGITFATYGGVQYAFDVAIGAMQTSYNSIESDMLALLNMAGFGEAFGIIMGAYATKAALKALNVFAMRV